ncbi:MAG: bifunctional DNA primase/polymerase [Bryobacteraceae bacterium]
MNERIDDVIAALALGPVHPLYGIVIGADGKLCCECGNQTCDIAKAGKHPRLKGWQKKATFDPAQIRKWAAKWPNGNFGIRMGILSVAIDLDLKQCRRGRAELDQLEFDVGERVANTVTVDKSGRKWSQHLFFRVPNVPLRNRKDCLPGIDFKTKGGCCVAPGSRHLSGDYYGFAEELRPDEIQLADMSEFLLKVVAPSHSRMPIPATETLSIGSINLLESRDSLPPLPDYKVVGALLRNSVGRVYWNGYRNPKQSKSEDDFALACKLAFYCRRDLKQMYRLLLRSGLYRPKFLEPRSGGNYAIQLCKKAIEVTHVVWIPKPRKSRAKPGAKRGRKLDSHTHSILLSYDSGPNRSNRFIADALGLSISKVRDTLSYHRMKARKIEVTNTHPCTKRYSRPSKAA